MTTVPTKTSSSGSTNVGLSDTHNMIYTTIKLRAPRLPPTTITYRDYKHFREDAYSADVSKIPKTVCQIFDDSSDNYWALQLLLTDVINEHAPLKTTKVKAREVPFMNKRLKRAIREKNRMYNQYRKRPSRDMSTHFFVLKYLFPILFRKIILFTIHLLGRLLI